MPNAKTKACGRCGTPIENRNQSGFCRVCPVTPDPRTEGFVPPVAPKAAPPVPADQVKADRQLRQVQADLADVRAKYKSALETIEKQEKQSAALNVLQSQLDTHRIEPSQGQGTSEGTVVVVASDWHVEENVGAEVGGLNVFNSEIAGQRADRFFQASLRLIRLLQQDIRIETTILALLGDFISGNIHDELMDTNEFAPTHAILTAQNFIISGIEFWLNHSTLKLVIPCHSGNHARTTKTTRFSAENGYSLEYLMYLHLAAYFRNEPRVQFVIPEGYHSYVDVYGYTIRFHHGHAVKYGGGVGGLFVPAYKKISQWQKGRSASLDCFGHFHQMKDGGNFLCNGSLIGYNAYALSIGADFEPPRQTLFLIDKRRGRTATWPILLS
jgi:hypothetical protein